VREAGPGWGRIITVDELSERTSSRVAVPHRAADDAYRPSKTSVSANTTVSVVFADTDHVGQRRR
jgi:hypothetical protein